MRGRLSPGRHPAALLINLSMKRPAQPVSAHLGPLTNSFFGSPQDHFHSFHSITQSAREDPAIPRATERHPLIVQICTRRCAILRQRPRIDLTFAHSWVTRFARLMYRGREDRDERKTAAECEQEQHASRGVAPQLQAVTRRSQETSTAEKIAQGIDITAFA